MKDYYAAAAQIIPLLVLALLVHRRIIGDDDSPEKEKHPGWRALVIFLLGVLSFLAEGAALQVLLQDGEGSPHQAGTVAMAITGLTLILFIVTIGPPLKDWWKQPHEKLKRWRSRIPTKEPIAIWIAAIAAGALVGGAYEWGRDHAPEEKQAKPQIEKQAKLPGPKIGQAHKAKALPEKHRDQR